MVQFGVDAVIAPRMEGLALPDPELMRASTEAAHANLSRSTPSLADYLMGVNVKACHD